MDKLCGICGIIGFEDRKLLKKMDDIIQHRGPDDSGIFIDNNVCLGNRRLSIIDLISGHQPIHNEDESIWIIFNGEIYNFLELKNILEKCGHKFYTNTDTEAIVHLYEEYGKEFIKKLTGMFAFAIWDGNKKELLLARDRIGIKPLYYSVIGRNLLFASEIKSILQYDMLKRKVNLKSLHNYLTLRYIPGSETILDGVSKLPPAHLLVYKNGRIKIEKYWDLKQSTFPEKTEEYYSKCLLELIKKSVKSELISDVPLGAYLSGGLDSSTMVAVMKQFVEEPIKTFTIGFGSEEHEDEFRYAKIVSNEFYTDHHEFTVDVDDISKLLPKIIWHLDEPLADMTNIPTYMLSELAKKYVTVVLTGEGGDELLSGYAHEKTMLLTERYKSHLSFIKKIKMTNLINQLPLSLLNKFFGYPASMGNEGRKRLTKYFLLDDKAKRYSIFVSTFDEKEKEKLYSNKLTKLTRNFLPVHKLFNPYMNNNDWLSNQMLLIDTKMWLPEYILLRLDKMTMANSLEGRVPLLNHSLLEFSFTIPSRFKLRGFTEKYILRKAVVNLLPKEILKRRKRPFMTPIHQWGEKQLMELFSKILSEDYIKRGKYFNYDYIKKILQNYRTSKLIYERKMWVLLTFVLWHKIFIESDKLSPPKSLDALLT